MTIPVMDSVLRMQEGKFEEVSEDFTTCIHCGLCRFVCEDKVKPHNMGLWVRRSKGMSRDNPSLNSSALSENGDEAEREWTYLLTGDRQERFKRAKYFRAHGRAQA